MTFINLVASCKYRIVALATKYMRVLYPALSQITDYAFGECLSRSNTHHVSRFSASTGDALLQHLQTTLVKSEQRPRYVISPSKPSLRTRSVLLLVQQPHMNIDQIDIWTFSMSRVKKDRCATLRAELAIGLRAAFIRFEALDSVSGVCIFVKGE